MHKFVKIVTMFGMEHDKPNDWREARRFRVFDLSQMGWTGTAIAEALGVSESAVSTWLKRARDGGGKQALRTVKASGRPSDLSPEQLAQLPQALENGAEHFGFRGQVWTRRRVGAVIRRLFGVSYSDSHVGRLIAKIKWSLQKPIDRATQRDEAAIKRWVEEDWPRIKKKPNRRTER